MLPRGRASPNRLVSNVIRNGNRSRAEGVLPIPKDEAFINVLSISHFGL